MNDEARDLHRGAGRSADGLDYLYAQDGPLSSRPAAAAATVAQSVSVAASGARSGCWIAGHLPYRTRERVESAFEVAGHLPAPQPIAVVSFAGQLIACNQPLLDLVAHTRQEVLGRPWTSVMPTWLERSRSLRSVDPEPFDDHLLCGDTRRAWVRVSAGPLVEGDEPQPLAYVLFVTDLAGCGPEDQQRLREEYQILAETQRDLVFKLDVNGRVLFASPSYCRLVGLSEQRILGSDLDSLMHPDDRAWAGCAMGQLVKPPFACSFQARVRMRSGWRAYAWTLDAVIEDGGRVTAVVAVGRDLSARLHSEEERRAAAQPPPASERPRETDKPSPGAEIGTSEAPAARRIADCLMSFGPDRGENLRAIAGLVAEIVGARCELYKVRRGDRIETAIGWRLPEE